MNYKQAEKYMSWEKFREEMVWAPIRGAWPWRVGQAQEAPCSKVEACLKEPHRGEGCWRAGVQRKLEQAEVG